MLGFEDSGTLPLVVFDDLLSSECTQAIMTDALKRKQMWMKKLEDLKTCARTKKYTHCTHTHTTVSSQ